MKRNLYNEKHTAGLVEIEDGDPHTQLIEIDPALLKDSLKMLDPYKPASIMIGILKAGEAGVLTLTPKGQTGTIAVEGKYEVDKQRDLDNFSHKEPAQE